MGLSCRMFVLASDDSLYRLTSVGFGRMLNEPEQYRIPELAGQRVRKAEAIVELVGGTPISLLRLTFSILTFDRGGHLDHTRLFRQQAARFESAFAPVLGRSTDNNSGVVDAASQFVAQGGTWHPSEPIRQRIEAAALGRTTCPRLSVVTR
jgi:hypothetical protein